LQLPEPAHARALQPLAGLQESWAPLNGHLIVRLQQTRHGEIDSPER
jgi:hypothetical protein